MPKRFINKTLKEKDLSFDRKLRPNSFEHFTGQAKIKERLLIALQAAKGRNEPLEHLLFFGPPGLGKTTLAYIIASEMGCDIKPTSGPTVEKPGDLAGLLTNLKGGDILFID